jgi:hypothetical protein
MFARHCVMIRWHAGRRTAAGKAFFFEKKKQKTFIRLAAAFPDTVSPDL